jgi:hypothetical protein
VCYNIIALETGDSPSRLVHTRNICLTLTIGQALLLHFYVSPHTSQVSFTENELYIYIKESSEVVSLLIYVFRGC